MNSPVQQYIILTFTMSTAHLFQIRIITKHERNFQISLMFHIIMNIILYIIITYINMCYIIKTISSLLNYSSSSDYFSKWEFEKNLFGLLRRIAKLFLICGNRKFEFASLNCLALWRRFWYRRTVWGYKIPWNTHVCRL